MNLDQLPRFPDQPDPNRVRSILEQLACPFTQLNYVHVTGTNGKGSTAAMVAAMAQASGQTVGLFTSPHLWKYNERIKLNGVDISDAVLQQYLDRVEPLLPAGSCLFEVMTIIALCYFCDQQVDVAVLEVGLGGRLDPTNSIPHNIALITNVGLEHQELLGATLAEIAREKAGIIKPQSVCFTTEPDPAVRAVIQAVADKQQAKLHYIDGDNGALATACARQLGISDQAIQQGLATVHWPLRFETIHTHPLVIADIAHNPHGLAYVQQHIRTAFPDRRKIIVTGCAQGRPYQVMMPMIAELGDTIIVTQSKRNGMPVEQLAPYLPPTSYLIPDIQQAVQQAMALAQPNDVVLILGGIYLTAEVTACYN
ncbi:MAG: hypothetical protein HY565_03120 [Candidatus Kerfeldbacteria bacterium]|nr:hypothetical protein [Candidatus Kerfeldbacteria bacterium]